MCCVDVLGERTVGLVVFRIMGKTTDLTVMQKTIDIDTLHKDEKSQKAITKEAGCSQSTVSKLAVLRGRGNVAGAQVTGMTAALRGLSSKSD